MPGSRNQKDVSLLIKARDESTKVFENISAALADLIDNQGDLATSAGATQSRVQQLAAALVTLDKAYSGIDAAANRAEQAFERQQTTINDNRADLASLTGQLAEARKAYERMASVADKAFIGPRADGFLAKFKAVSAEMEALERRATSLNRTIAGQETALAGSRSSLQQIGSTAIAAADAQARLRAEVVLETAALEEQAAAAQRVTAIQARINAATGVDRSPAGSAAASAEVLAEAAARDHLFQRLKAEEAERAVLARQQEAEIANRRLLNISDTPTNSARDSAAVFQAADASALKSFETANRDANRQAREAADATKAEADQIARLRADLDPTAAILARAAAEQEKLNRWFREGKITATEFAAAEKLVAQSAKDAVAAMKAGTANSPKVSLFGLRPYETQNLLFQINDIGTQLASGTSLGQTLAQQGGQIFQLFQNRVGPAIASAFSNPAFLSAGAVLGVFVIGLNHAANEAERLRDLTSSLSSSADGGLYDPKKLTASADALDRYGVSAKDAVAAIRLFAAEGVAPNRIDQFGVAAKNLADTMGIKLVDAAKQVTDAFTGGFDAIDKLDKATNTYTATQREHIRALFEEGDASRARAEAFAIFTAKQQEAADLSRGAWSDAARALSNAWDGLIKAIGNSDPIKGAISDFDDLARSITSVLNKLTGVRALKDVVNDINDLHNRIGALNQSIASLGDPFGAKQSQIDEYVGRLRTLIAEQKKLAAAPQPGAGGDTSAQATERQRKADADVDRRIARDQAAQKAASAAERIRTAEVEARLTAQDAGASRDAADRAAVAAGNRTRREIEKEITAEKKKQAEEARKAAEFVQLRDPVNGPVSSGFGARKSPGGVGSTFHKGIDFAVPVGTSVKAPAAGVVEAVGFSPELGKYIVIDHGSGTKSKLGHLSVNDIVRAGDLVQAGQEIGKSGNTGSASTGPHVHFSVESGGKFVDPRTNGGKFKGNVGDAALTASDDAEKAAARSLQAQNDLNLAIEQGNRARQDSIDALTAEAGLVGQALIDTQKQAAVDKAEADLRKRVENSNKNLKPGETAVTVTQEQIDKTRELTAAEFELQHVRERAQIDRKAVDQPVADLTAQRDALLRQIDQYQNQGKSSLAEGLGPALADVNTRLDEAITKAREFYATLAGDGGAAEKARAAQTLTKDQVDNITIGLQTAQTATQSLGYFLGVSLDAAAEKFASGASNAFDTFFGAVAQGKSVFGALRSAFLSFAADFLREIAQMIVKQLFFNAISTFIKGLGLGAGGGAGGAIGGSVFNIPDFTTTTGTINFPNAISLHSGGLAGAGGGNARLVDPAWFANAARYHTGGIAGLLPDELPAILQRGEEVLTRSDPRHRDNAGSGKADVKIINAIDSGDLMSKGLDTRVGQQSILNFIRANSDAVSAAIGKK